MAIDAYFIKAQISELKSKLLNGKLRRINGESSNSLSLDFFVFGKRAYLLFDVSPNKAHMRIIDNFNNNEQYNFIDVLKNELLNSTLVDIKQYKTDRIIFFTFMKNDPFLGPLKKTLVFEVMGRNSNLILLDENGVIINSFKKVFNEDKRSILPNIKYEIFPTTKKEFSFGELNNLKSPDELFYNFMGFSKEFAEFIYNNRLNPDNLKLNPTLYLNKRISFHAYDLNLKGQKIKFNNTSSLLNHYYELTTKSDDYLKQILLKQEKRLLKKILNLSTEHTKNQDYEQYKLIADEIYMSGLDLNKHYDKFKSHKLDIKISLNRNAQKLYNKYKRKKNSLNFLAKQINKTKEELAYYEDYIKNYHTFSKDDLKDLKVELEDLGLIRRKKKKETAPRKYLKYELNNAICIVGKTAKQNEKILRDIAKGEDYWFHVQDYPGAHVILKGEKSEENISFAAKQALLNSPLKEVQKGYVNYTKVKYVKKITNRVGFYVTYKNSKTLFVTL